MVRYELKEFLEFKIPDSDYSVLAGYEKVNKGDKKGYDISIWLNDVSKTSPLYSKYICGDFVKANESNIKHTIRINIDKMIENKVFNRYIAEFEKEIEYIGEVYIKEEKKRLKKKG